LNDKAAERGNTVTLISRAISTFCLSALGLSFILSFAAADELDDLAAAEGEVSYYAQGPRQVYSDLVERFEAKYPKIKVRITPGRYDVIDKINQQLGRGDAPDADIVTAQTVQDIVKWSNSGALMNFRPAGVETIPDNLKGNDFFPLSLYVIGIAYNSNSISENEAPKSVKDFLNPQFRDKIASTFPHDDDVTLYLYRQIERKYGWSFFTKLMAQKPRFVRSHVLVADLVKTGARPVTFDQITSFNSSNFVPPADIPMVVFPYGIAAFAKAKHPNAAKLFLSFSLSKDEQERFVKRNIWSARSDVGPPNGFKPLASYRVAKGFIAFISDAKNATRLRMRFEKIIGQISGEYINVAPTSAKPQPGDGTPRRSE
jgi:ABC-type Fe3+ transport system substrate-binding protein